MSILAEYLASMSEDERETDSFKSLDRLTKPEEFEGPDDMGEAFEEALDYNPLDVYTRLDLFNRFDSITSLLEDGPEKDALLARRVELVDEAHENMKDERYEIAADYMDGILMDRYGDLMAKVFGDVDKAEEAFDELLAQTSTHEDEDEYNDQIPLEENIPMETMGSFFQDDEDYQPISVERASSMDSELEQALISESSLISTSEDEDDDEDVFLISDPNEEDEEESA